MIELNSSMIKQASYDAMTGILTLVMNGGTYRYLDVPQDIYDGLLTAESAGKYFAQNIKGKFSFEKA